jgi:hypothetical protein
VQNGNGNPDEVWRQDRGQSSAFDSTTWTRTKRSTPMKSSTASPRSSRRGLPGSLKEVHGDHRAIARLVAEVMALQLSVNRGELLPPMTFPG